MEGGLESSSSNYKRTRLGVGYIGVGKYKSRDGEYKTKEYKVWSAMLARCYSPTYAKSENYEDVTVTEEWFNFQTFSEWLNNQKGYADGWELDKDILHNPNRIYSPETCCLIPQEINKLLTNRAACRGDLPIGVTRDGNGYRACMTQKGKNIYLGMFKCPEKAHLKYKTEKEDYIAKTVLEYEGVLAENILKRLGEFRVKRDM